MLRWLGFWPGRWLVLGRPWGGVHDTRPKEGSWAHRSAEERAGVVRGHLLLVRAKEEIGRVGVVVLPAMEREREVRPSREGRWEVRLGLLGLERGLGLDD